MSRIPHYLISITALVLSMSISSASFCPFDPEEYRLTEPSIILPSPESAITMYRPCDCVKGSGDTLYIVDDQDCVVRVFTTHGKYLFTFGGRGQGPGEFRAPRVIEYSNGRVFVLDVASNQISELSSSGEFIRTITLHKSCDDFEVDQDFLYIATSWFSGGAITRISRESPDNRTELLASAAEYFPEVDNSDFYSLGMGSGRIRLSFMDNQLIAAFTRVGIVAVMPTDTEGLEEPKFIMLDHPLIERYKSDFRKRLREYEGPGSIVPNVMWEATPWLNGRLACHIRTFDQDEYEDVKLVLFSLENGREVGVVRAPDFLLSSIRLIEPNLVAGIDNDAATVLLCDVHR